jgi:hypothetical protein
LYGLATFSKRAVLCGEDSRAHIFTSSTRLCGPDGPSVRSANRPTAVVEVTDTNSQNAAVHPKHILPLNRIHFAPLSSCATVPYTSIHSYKRNAPYRAERLPIRGVVSWCLLSAKQYRPWSTPQGRYHYVVVLGLQLHSSNQWTFIPH